MSRNMRLLDVSRVRLAKRRQRRQPYGEHEYPDYESPSYQGVPQVDGHGLYLRETTSASRRTTATRKKTPLKRKSFIQALKKDWLGHQAVGRLSA
jgi:hypothetical protein